MVIAREIQRKREAKMDNPPLAMFCSSNEETDSDSRSVAHGEEVVVCLGGMFGDAYLVQSGTSDVGITSSVTKLATGGSEDDEASDEDSTAHLVNISELEYEPAGDFAQVKVAGESRALQVSFTNRFCCMLQNQGFVHIYVHISYTFVVLIPKHSKRCMEMMKSVCSSLPCMALMQIS